MLDFAEITIDDKELFDRYLKIDNPQASDVSFTNLFMWRNYYKFRYIEVQDLLCIVSVPDDSQPFALAPIGAISEDKLAEVIALLKEYFNVKGWKLVFRKVEESKVDYFRRFTSSEENIILDRDNCDYVYLSTDLVHLKGKKFDGKRNHINKFKKLYEYEYVSIGEEHFDHCSRIMDKWCEERDCDDHKGFYCEKLANIELLSNFSKLGCKGALIKVDGVYEGFTVGEILNNDTAVIHIEKANSHINGLYTLINQQFCENEWQNVTFINREQDLGIEGLRKAKLSYNPVKLINKYTISL